MTPDKYNQQVVDIFKHKKTYNPKRNNENNQQYNQQTQR